jgi:ABC-2 type transport system permease protein
MVLSLFSIVFFILQPIKQQTAESLPIIIVDEEQSYLSNTIIPKLPKSKCQNY